MISSGMRTMRPRRASRALGVHIRRTINTDVGGHKLKRRTTGSERRLPSLSSARLRDGGEFGRFKGESQGLIRKNWESSSTTHHSMLSGRGRNKHSEQTVQNHVRRTSEFSLLLPDMEMEPDPSECKTRHSKPCRDLIDRRRKQDNKEKK